MTALAGMGMIVFETTPALASASDVALLTDDDAVDWTDVGMVGDVLWLHPTTKSIPITTATVVNEERTDMVVSLRW
jgi:hypothetical protein